MEPELKEVLETHFTRAAKPGFILLSGTGEIIDLCTIYPEDTHEVIELKKNIRARLEITLNELTEELKRK